MTPEELDAIKEKANRDLPITPDEVLRLVAALKQSYEGTRVIANRAWNMIADYAFHDEECSRTGRSDSPPCSCGYDEAIQAYHDARDAAFQPSWLEKQP